MSDIRFTKALDLAAHMAWLATAQGMPGLLLDPADEDGLLARHPTPAEVDALACAIACVVPPGTYFRETPGGGIRYWSPGEVVGDGRPFANPL